MEPLSKELSKQDTLFRKYIHSCMHLNIRSFGPLVEGTVCLYNSSGCQSASVSAVQPTSAC